MQSNFETDARGIVNTKNSNSAGHQRRWKCPVCSHTNTIAASMLPTSTQGVPLKCAECGIVPKRCIDDLLVPGPTDVADSSQSTEEDGVQCPTCTFLNHPCMVVCEMCDAPLQSPQKASPKPSSRNQSPFANLGLGDAAGRPASAPPYGSTPPLLSNGSGSTEYAAGHISIKLSFRSGGSSAFFSALNNALQAKAWEKPSPRAVREVQMHKESWAGELRGFGISRVIDQAQRDQDTKTRALRDGFADLEALTEKATEMVALAEQLSKTMRRAGQQTQRARSLSASANPPRAGAGGDSDAEDDVDPAFKQYLVDIGLENA
ncbi:Vacuolar protein-sorting-associated protein 36, partial [Spiromyces aspiralis]